MNEQEAAEKLAALLTEIEAAGHLVDTDTIPVGQKMFVACPNTEEEPWEVVQR